MRKGLKGKTDLYNIILYKSVLCTADFFIRQTWLLYDYLRI